MITKEEKTKLQGELTVAHHDYQKGLNARAFFKLHNIMTSEDLVQSTFMKTWLYLLKGGKVIVMKAFLYNILNNLIVDEYRKKKTTSLDTLLEKGFDQGVDESAHISDTLDGRAAFHLIHRLPKKYREIMRMKYIKILSIKEISTMTGQSKNAVAVQAHRGLKKLKVLYKSI